MACDSVKLGFARLIMGLQKDYDMASKNQLATSLDVKLN